MADLAEAATSSELAGLDLADPVLECLGFLGSSGAGGEHILAKPAASGRTLAAVHAQRSGLYVPWWLS